MAKDRKFPIAMPAEDPALPVAGGPASERDIADAVVATVEVLCWNYVGSNYFRGIDIPEREGLQRPRDWSPEQISDFMVEFPHYAEWFEQAPMTDPEETL